MMIGKMMKTQMMRMMNGKISIFIWENKMKEDNLKIVVFGCDNTGKTTLCNDIKEHFDLFFDVEVAKSIGANKTVEQYVDFMKTNLEKDNIVIFDRFPIIEEATCGKVLRDNNIFEKWEKEDVIGILKSVDVYIMCYPGLFNTLNWGEREQMDGVKLNAIKLINAYNEMAFALKEMGLNVYEFNYSYHNVYKFMLVIRKDLGLL